MPSPVPQPTSSLQCDAARDQVPLQLRLRQGSRNESLPHEIGRVRVNLDDWTLANSSRIDSAASAVNLDKVVENLRKFALRERMDYAGIHGASALPGFSFEVVAGSMGDT